MEDELQLTQNEIRILKTYIGETNISELTHHFDNKIKVPDKVINKKEDQTKRGWFSRLLKK